jgi:hypothetical protein
LPWSVLFRLEYRIIRLLDPLIRFAWHGLGPWLEPLVELRVPGRRSGRERRLLLTALALDGRRYIGHPNGSAAWTRNLEAAPSAEIVDRHGRVSVVSAIHLPPGDERTRVIVATAWLQPPPGNLVYRLARAHILQVGAYFRLEPVPVRQPEAVSPADRGG